MEFLLKKLVGGLLMPLPGTLILIAVGTVLWHRGHRRWGRALVAGPCILLWLASLPPVADALIRRVETREPAFPGDSVDFVVVLGGGHVSEERLPLSARLSSPTLHRLAEGVAIARAQPWSTLVFSGWGGADTRSNAEVYRDVALAWGVPAGRMRVEPRPRDTHEEAELLAPVLRGRAFALVTSATHMDRALAHFRAQGLNPVPAPTGHLAQEPRAYGVLGLIPGESELWRTRVAVYEILGRAWARLRGQS